MSFIREGFANLYTTSHLEAKLQPSPTSPWQAVLSEIERDNLYDTVSMEEIKSAPWLIKAIKAPRLDGLLWVFSTHLDDNWRISCGGDKEML